MKTFKWKRRKFVYTVSDNDGNFLFTLDAQTQIGPPPKAMKHQAVLKEIELRLEADFGEKTEPTPDQTGDIII